MEKSPIVEGIKEFWRIIVVAAIPILVLSLESGTSLKVTLVTLGVAVLKALDKYLHERKDINTKGLVPF